MGILQLLATRNYIIVNKDLIKLVGLEEAIILGELASEYEYWLNQNKLEDGYFYSTIDNIESNILLTEHKQRKILNGLKDKGLIDLKIKGIPAKRYIKINENEVLKLFNIKFLKNLGTCSKKNKEFDVKNFEINNNNINNKNNNIYNYYENIFARTLNGIEYETITKWLEDKTEEEIKNAINETAKSNIDNIKYVEKVLYSNKKKNNKVIPEWYNKEIEESEEEVDEEFKKFIKEFRR